jgi:LppP/LprE lipoprotein
VREDDRRAMAAHAMGYPPAPRRRRWPSRILGVLATAALLGTGVAIALMVIPRPDEEVAAPAATPAPVDENAAKAGLTPAQKAARRSAVTTLDEQGFRPVRVADWHPEHTLRVLIGRDEAGAERAFFFVKRRFVGNDDAAASASVRVSAARENGVTLTYRLYGSTDQSCCPKGDRVKVTFRWKDGTLVPAGDVPAAFERLR